MNQATQITSYEIQLRDLLMLQAKHQAEADRAARISRVVKRKIERLYREIETGAEGNPFD